MLLLQEDILDEATFYSSGNYVKNIAFIFVQDNEVYNNNKLIPKIFHQALILTNSTLNPILMQNQTFG